MRKNIKMSGKKKHNIHPSVKLTDHNSIMASLFCIVIYLMYLMHVLFMSLRSQLQPSCLQTSLNVSLEPVHDGKAPLDLPWHPGCFPSLFVSSLLTWETECHFLPFSIACQFIFWNNTRNKDEISSGNVNLITAHNLISIPVSRVIGTGLSRSEILIMVQFLYFVMTIVILSLL